MTKLIVVLTGMVLLSGAIANPAKEGGTRYGLSGKMTVQPGQRDKVVGLLLRDVKELKAAGCEVYAVSVSPEQADSIWVYEVWTSREAHRASIKLPTVLKAIGEAKPFITGMSDQLELSVVGGLGVGG